MTNDTADDIRALRERMANGEIPADLWEIK